MQFKEGAQVFSYEIQREGGEDVMYLNCLSPNIEPRATEHISDIINMITKLLETKNAYVSGGHVFFDVLSFKDYTKLTGRCLDEMFDGVRIEANDANSAPQNIQSEVYLANESGVNNLYNLEITASSWSPNRVIRNISISLK